MSISLLALPEIVPEKNGEFDVEFDIAATGYMKTLGVQKIEVFSLGGGRLALYESTDSNYADILLTQGAFQLFQRCGLQRGPRPLLLRRCNVLCRRQHRQRYRNVHHRRAARINCGAVKERGKEGSPLCGEEWRAEKPIRIHDLTDDGGRS